MPAWVSEAKRLKSLEENGKLKRLLADAMLDVSTLRECFGKNRLRTNAVTSAIENKDYSQRRACGLVGMKPRVYRYHLSRQDDLGLSGRLRELAAERRH